MAQLPTKRYGAYLRKMAIDGYIIQVDTTDIKEMTKALGSSAGTSINRQEGERRRPNLSSRYGGDPGEIGADMAVTKTHPIKSTLKAASTISAIQTRRTEAAGVLLRLHRGDRRYEFAWTCRHAIDKGTNLGRHLIQRLSLGGHAGGGPPDRHGAARGGPGGKI